MNCLRLPLFVVIILGLLSPSIRLSFYFYYSRLLSRIGIDFDAWVDYFPFEASQAILYAIYANIRFYRLFFIFFWFLFAVDSPAGPLKQALGHGLLLAAFFIYVLIVLLPGVVGLGYSQLAEDVKSTAIFGIGPGLVF